MDMDVIGDMKCPKIPKIPPYREGTIRHIKFAIVALCGLQIVASIWVGVRFNYLLQEDARNWGDLGSFQGE